MCAIQNSEVHLSAMKYFLFLNQKTRLFISSKVAFVLNSQKHLASRREKNHSFSLAKAI